ncbi:MAG: Fur family transcriptional regulator [Acidimicrobiales bacterium]
MAGTLHDTVATRLRGVQQRYTLRRRALVEALAGTERPLAIADLLAAQPVAAQSSVYRNLAVLGSAGVVRRVAAEDEFSRFELAEDLTSHHHHLLCSACGRVADYTLPERLERAMEKAITEVSSQTGFRARAHRVDLVGVCAACA